MVAERDIKVVSINQYGLVVAKTKILDVPKGAIGTVIHIYDDGNAYEVEFIVNDSYVVETVLRTQIEAK